VPVEKTPDMLVWFWITIPSLVYKPGFKENEGRNALAVGVYSGKEKGRLQTRIEWVS
jgi:hypothetical protein